MRLKEPSTFKVRYTLMELNRPITPMKVFLTGDWHVSPIVSERQYEFLKDALERTQPDVIILQGDLVDSPIELKRETSLKKLIRELKLCRKYAPTVMVMGNHDYITPIKPIEVKKEFALSHWHVICEKCDIKLLLDEWAEIGDLRIFGLFQEEGTILHKTKGGTYLYKESSRPCEKKLTEFDFSNLPTDKINWFAAHVPTLSNKVLEKCHEFDAMSFGHTHGGMVFRGIDEFFEKAGINAGIFSAGKRPFPTKTRGSWVEKHGGMIIINAGMTGAQFCAPKLVQQINFAKAAEVNLIEIKPSKEKTPR